MKIAFYPYHSTENKYANIIITILKTINGVEVCRFDPMSYLRFSKKIWSAKLIWLNWFELDHGQLKNVLKIWILFLLKLTGKRIVYTLHNKKLHNKKVSALSSLLQNSLYYFADTIVIHSHASERLLPTRYLKKIKHIPHPNYIGEYGAIVTTEAEKKLKLLFLGQVKPYKNIELLINTLSEINHKNLELTIAGKPISEEYKQQLIKLASGTDVKFIFEFVHDNQINEYLSACDLLVLPYDMASSLNSGTVILAFSYAKTIICPLIGTIGDLKSNAFLTYTYEDKAGHHQALKKQLQKAIELKLNDINIFDNWGKEMYDEVLKNNSKELIKRLIEQNILKNNVYS